MRLLYTKCSVGVRILHVYKEMKSVALWSQKTARDHAASHCLTCKENTCVPLSKSNTKNQLFVLYMARFDSGCLFEIFIFVY